MPEVISLCERLADERAQVTEVRAGAQAQALLSGEV